MKLENYTIGLLYVFSLLISTVAYGQSDEAPPSKEQVIIPEVERREIKIPHIDTEDFELGIFVGAYSLEDFGTNLMYGMSAAYHVTEDIFFEATLARTEVDDSTFRKIGLPVFPNEDENLDYYSASVGYNLFPGEFFFGSRRAFTTQLYVIGGAGNTRFIDENHFTYNYGGGLRVLFTDWTALRLDVRDNVFELDLLGKKKTTHNLSTTVGLTIFY